MFAKRVLMLFILLSLNLQAATYYVDASRINDSGPGTSWASAKKTIQSAVNLTSVGDTVLVTNGVYNTGATVTTNGTLLNRLFIDKNITVKSVNGAAYTFIEGSGTNFFNTASAVRCVYMSNTSKLEGFTLRYGTTLALATGRYDRDTSGGGLCALYGYTEIRNCIIRECFAASGGGTYGGTLYSCLLTRNKATNGGGGCTFGTLYSCLIYANEANGAAGSYYGTRVNCTIVGNRSATPSGCGFMYGNTYNCIVWNNTYNGVVNNYFISTSGSTISSTCTTPLPSGMGNITSDPLFLNASAQDYRLRTGSPCINAGSNTNVFGTTDLAGNPRIQNGTVDMGAYEGSDILATITFDPLGGQVTPGNKVVTFGSLYGALPLPSLEGHTFAGWRTSTNGTVFGVTSNSVVAISTNHTLAASWTANTYTLTLLNARGDAVPMNGEQTYLYGDAVVARVPSVITEGNTRYVCTGATVDGNDYTQTGSTNVTLTLTNNAVLAWQWSTNYFLSLTATNGLIVNTSEGWKPVHSNYSLFVQADPGYRFDHWEMNGLPIGSGMPLSLTMDQTTSIIAVFRSLLSDLLLWNRLGSTNQVRYSEVGPNGTLNAGRFVDGPFGKGIELNMQELMGVTFPPHVVPGADGCIEFWAKLTGFPARIWQPGGTWPGLVGHLNQDGNLDLGIYFASNDGAAKGGICARAGSLDSCGTGFFSFYWTYANALKTNTVTDWHHYALVWATNGIPEIGQQKVAVYVNGQLNTGYWGGGNGSNLAIPTNGLFGLLFHQGVESSSVAFDNIKIWNFAKTDFNDRFEENAGDLRIRRVLSIVNARGQAVPANGDRTYIYGDPAIACVPSVITEGNTRYVCTGATVDGNDFTQAGPTNVTLTLTNNAVLAWQWSTNYFLSLTSTNGLILNTEEGWKPANSNYELSVKADPGYRFDHWEMNGLSFGSGVPLSLTMDQANTIIAFFSTLFMDVSSNVYWNATWVFNPRKGYFIGTLTITNTNEFKVLTAPFWFQVESTTNHWLRYPTGTNGNTGIPYLDITTAVTNQLPRIGNGDLAIDRGESVTVTGIELMGRRAPAGVVIAVWADPPGMIANPVDSDGDGMSDVDEYIAGTSAVDPDSVFRIRLGADGRSVQWDGKPNRVYTVLTSTNLSQGFVIEQNNIPSSGKTMTHPPVQRTADPGTSGMHFLRVNVNLK